jgi:hypothetical protein
MSLAWALESDSELLLRYRVDPEDRRRRNQTSA